jgi:outer membrane immunogenic protein
LVGGGVEGALDRHWTIKLEYLYMDFGTINALVTGAGTTATVIPNNTDFLTAVTTSRTLSSAFSTRVTDTIVHIGFNYKFDSVR